MLQSNILNHDFQKFTLLADIGKYKFVVSCLRRALKPPPPLPPRDQGNFFLGSWVLK